jgi:hypothetical protein
MHRCHASPSFLTILAAALLLADCGLERPSAVAETDDTMAAIERHLAAGAGNTALCMD